MLSQMLLRRGKSLLRSVRPSFAGTGLLERMRSTAFALLGVTAAMALGLVALAAQQDWPLLPAAPIPGVSEPAELGEARIAAVGPGVGSARATITEPGGEGAVRHGGGKPSRRGPQSTHVSGSRQLPTASPQAPSGGPATNSPAAPGAPAASPSPAPSAASAPAATPPSNPAPAPSAPLASSPPGSEPVAVSGVKDGRDESDDDENDDHSDAAAGRDRGKSSGKPRSPGGWKGGRPAKGSGSDADLAPPPPAPPPPTAVPTAPEDAADKEAADDAASQAPTYPGRGRGHGGWRSRR